MSDSIEKHLKKVIKYIKTQIQEGKASNRHHLDGYTLSGLKNKLQILEECYNKLTKN